MLTNTINTNKIFNAISIAASGNILSQPFDLNKFKPNGYYSLQVLLTGTGTCKLEILVSNDEEIGETTAMGFMLPTAGSSIATGLTTGSYFSTITLPPCRHFKIKCTETGAANAIVITAKLVII